MLRRLLPVLIGFAVAGTGVGLAAASRVAERVAAGAAVASVAPTQSWTANGYRVSLHVSSDTAPSAMRATVALANGGGLVHGARVRLTVTMLDMQMPGLTHTLRETQPGRYAAGGFAFGMAGRWGLRVEVSPAHGRAFSVGAVDRVRS